MMICYGSTEEGGIVKEGFLEEGPPDLSSEGRRLPDLKGKEDGPSLE